LQGGKQLVLHKAQQGSMTIACFCIGSPKLLTHFPWLLLVPLMLDRPLDVLARFSIRQDMFPSRKSYTWWVILRRTTVPRICSGAA